MLDRNGSKNGFVSIKDALYKHESGDRDPISVCDIIICKLFHFAKWEYKLAAIMYT